MLDARTSISRKALVVLAAMLAVAVLASGCSSSKKSASGGGNSSASTGGSSTTNTVQVKNFAFSPASLTVAKGTKVTWVFDDTTGHTVAASDNSFKSGTLSNGGTYSFTFNTAGTYNYICSIHPFMKGSVTVQ